MVRPRRFRRIFQEPQIRCFKPDLAGDIDQIKPVEITIDEFEAIRLKDYQNINRKKQS